MAEKECSIDSVHYLIRFKQTVECNDEFKKAVRTCKPALSKDVKLRNTILKPGDYLETLNQVPITSKEIISFLESKKRQKKKFVCVEFRREIAKTSSFANISENFKVHEGKVIITPGSCINFKGLTPYELASVTGILFGIVQGKTLTTLGPFDPVINEESCTVTFSYEKVSERLNYNLIDNMKHVH